MDLTSQNKDRKRKSVDMSGVYAKVPPQAKELEEAVLGAILVERSAYDIVSGIIHADAFYVEANQQIYRAIESLNMKSIPVDILTVVEELKVREQLDIVGGPYYVMKLTNGVVSTANVEAHARIVLQKFIQRELIRISGEIIGLAYEDSTDAFELQDQAETSILALSENTTRKDYVSAGQAVVKVVERVDKLRFNNGKLTGVPTGYSELDRITFGWQEQDLIILAARPSVGKTAYALNLARNSALNPTKPVPVGFFSLEMSTSQLMMRTLAIESGIGLESISRGKMTDNDYTVFMGNGVRKMETAPIYIDDTAAINLNQFRSKARRMVNKHGVGLIIIDYLQLMSGSNNKGNREQEISAISRGLKATAKQLNVPIIALSQLSRNLENRSKGEQRPRLSDLRESGAIEQDADMVMFLYRPEYHGDNVNHEGESTSGETELLIAKHRNGVLATLKFQANLSIQKFTEWNGEAPLSNWKPMKDITEPKRFDDGFDTNRPF